MTASRFEETFQDRVISAANRAFGVTVTYSRGVLTTASFTARRTQRIHEAESNESGLSVKFEIREYYLPAVSLVLDGKMKESQRGDRITEGTEVWEIQPAEDGMNPVQKLPGGYEWKVTTKRVA